MTGMNLPAGRILSKPQAGKLKVILAASYFLFDSVRVLSTVRYWVKTPPERSRRQILTKI
jgi:hypothetical protein